jgi:hypothetical protein
MAFPSKTIYTNGGNKITIQNNETVLINFGMQRFDTSLITPIYVNVTAGGVLYTASPTESIGPELSKTIQLPQDGIYKLYFKDLITSAVQSVVILTTGNVDACEKKILQDFLCRAQDQCKVDECDIVKEQMKFFSLKSMVSFYYKQIVSIDGVNLDSISITNSDVIDIATAIDTLTAMCGCEMIEVSSGNFVIDESCGCIKYN